MFPWSAAIVAAVVPFAGSSLQAATYTKANSIDDLDTTPSWVEGIVPTSGDIALWNNTVTAANITTTGSGVNFGQIKIVNPTGLVTINAGVSGGLTLTGVAGVGIDMLTATQNLTINAPITLAGDQQWNVVSGRTLIIGGTTGFNQGTNNITLNGTGTVQFTPTFATPANATATGNFTVNGGTLFLSTGNTSGFPGLTNILSPLTTLTLGGGTLSTTVGNSVGTYTQNFNGLTLNAGGSTLTQARGTSSLVVVNLGAITRNLGGTANLVPSSNNSGFRTTTANVNGILSGGITLNGTDFAQATNSTTNISAAAYTNDAWAATNNTTVTIDGTQTDATTNSLRFATAAANTLTLSGVNTIASGGILVSSAVGAFDKTITGGTLQGSPGLSLIINQYNTAGLLNIASTIADNTSATALTKTGGGTVVLSGNNTFTGGVFLNAGTIRLGNAGALNSAAPNSVLFTNNSSGILALNGNSVTVSGLNTATVVAATRPIVQNANAAAATLTINNATNGTFGGNIQDGAGGGALSLTKQGAGTQNLTGTLSYTGNTTVAGGKLAISSTLAGSVAVNSGATLDVSAASSGLVVASGKTLSGAGTIIGAATLGNGTTANPGGSGAVGTLTIDTLTLNSGSTVNFEFGSGVNDKFSITTGLTFGTYASGGFNLLTTSGGQLMTTGVTYTLFDYSASAGISGFSNLSSALILNPVGGLSYTFANDTLNHRITLTLSGTVAVSSNWIQDGVSGNWSASANWQGGVIPNGATQTANFVSTTPNNPAHTVILDSNRTVGAITFNSPTSYTISGANTLTLNNGANSASITDNGGSHTISAALALVSTTAIGVANSADTLTISGNISGNPTGGLIKTGAGTLALSGVNTYSGGTFVSGGNLLFSSLGNLGTGEINLSGGGLLYAAGNTTDISTRTVTFGVGDGRINVGANDVVFANAVGNNGSGGLIKAGTGKLTLAAGNTFTGASTITGGTLAILDDTSLGVVPGVAATNLTFDPGAGNSATLQNASGLALTLNVNRNIVFASGTGVFDTNGFDMTFAGATSGAGDLSKTGVGVLNLTGVSTGTGNTILNAGTINIANRGSLPTGTITLNGTTGITMGNVATNVGNLVVNGTNFVTKSGNSNILGVGALTGAGTLTVNSNFVADLTGDTSNFTGTFISNGNGAGAGTTRFFGATGGTNFTLDVRNFVNVRSAATVITLGSLVGNGSLSGAGGGVTQAVNFTIGSKTVGGVPVDSNFTGVISNNAGAVSVTKVGASKLTLGGVNTYTGATTINGGTLQVSITGSLSASSPVAVNTTGTLTGSGTVGAVTVNGGGTIAGGGTNGTVLHTGALTIAANGALSSTLSYNGLIPNYNTVAVSAGLINLASGANLQLTLNGGFVGSAGDIFFLIDNQNLDSITGTFTNLNGVATNLEEGSIFTVGSHSFQITYLADTSSYGFTGGNDVALMAVPEPGTIALLVGGAGVLFLIRRRRSSVQ